jgi:hypothetical protein
MTDAIIERLKAARDDSESDVYELTEPLQDDGIYYHPESYAIDGYPLGNIIGAAIQRETQAELAELAADLERLLGPQEFRVYAGERSC